MLKHFSIGMVVVAILAGVNLSFEGNWFEREIERMTYRLQQLRLVETSRAEDLPVVVVDVSALPRQPRMGSRDSDMVTDRARLLAIIAAVADRGARAIGIDILLDPPSGGGPTKSEEALLDFALAGGRPLPGPPIFVAVSNDGFVRGKDAWLGGSKYAPVAAMSVVPAFEDSHPFQMMPRLVWRSPEKQDRHSTPTNCDHLPMPCLESLAQRLAHTGEEQGGRFAKWMVRWLPWALYQNEAAQFPSGSPLHAVVFPINFGWVPLLQSRTIRASSEADVAAADFTDKFVLIGRSVLGNAEDTFNVAVLNEPVAGVYLHAAATVTLLRAPVFFLTSPGAFFLDLVVGAFAVAAVALIRHRWHSEQHPQLAAYAVAALAATVVFVIGFFAFTLTGILWPQCLPVMVALLFHPLAEQLFAAARTRMPQALFGWMTQRRQVAK